MLTANKGSTFILVLVVMAVLSIFGLTILSISLHETKTVEWDNKRMQAYYLARSGADTVSTYILRNPLDAETLVSAPESDTNNHFSNGYFKVDVKQGAASNEVIVESSGTVGNVNNTVKVLMNALSPGDIIDKAIYTNKELDITGMNVDGDVQSGESIQYSTNGNNEYFGNHFPNALRYIKLKTFPTSLTEYTPSNLEVKNFLQPIDNSSRFSSISVEQNGILKITTGNKVIQIVADNLTIDNILDIDSSGGGRVELYINNKMTVTTKGVINNTEPHKLFIYLKAGSLFEMQANMILNGYIIGPDATVQYQSAQSTTNGAIIANVLMKNAHGNGANGAVNYVPLPQGFDFGDALCEYRIEKWMK